MTGGSSISLVVWAYACEEVLLVGLVEEDEDLL
jgi:hypothetical protein